MKLVEEIKKVMIDIDMRMTIRQIYYQLVSRQIIEGSRKSYQNFVNTMTRAREQGLIDNSFIVDTSKPELIPSSWDSLKEFLEDVEISYKKKVGTCQKNYVEVWLEKDALRGIFLPITKKYDVPLIIGRGYQSFTNLLKAKKRFPIDKNIHILYFGDFDPSGLDIPRNIKEKLEGFGLSFCFHRVGLTPEQILEYSIPPISTKPGDSRSKKFVEKYGDVAAELDALEPRCLFSLIESSILQFIDVTMLRLVQEEEKADLSKLQVFIETFEVKESS